jgi:hypothetical protein
MPNMSIDEIVLYEPKSHESKWLRYFMFSIGSVLVLSYLRWKDPAALIVGTATLLYGAFPLKDRRKISISEGTLIYRNGFFGNRVIKISEIKTIQKRIAVDNGSNGTVSVKTNYHLNLITGKTEFIPHVFTSTNEAVFEEYFKEKLVR